MLDLKNYLYHLLDFLQKAGNMLKIFGPKIPRKIYIACSGGVDSMCALSFLVNGKCRDVKVVFFHHGTTASIDAYKFLADYVTPTFGVNIKTVLISRVRPPSKSQEMHWRDERYKFIYYINHKIIWKTQ